MTCSLLATGAITNDTGLKHMSWQRLVYVITTPMTVDDQYVGIQARNHAISVNIKISKLAGMYYSTDIARSCGVFGISENEVKRDKLSHQVVCRDIM